MHAINNNPMYIPTACSIIPATPIPEFHHRIVWLNIKKIEKILLRGGGPAGQFSSG